MRLAHFVFLSQLIRSKAELAAEAKEDAAFAQHEDAKRSKEEKDMLNRVWEAPDEQLSEKDKFLRSYFLEKKWEADTDRIQGDDDGFNSDAGSCGSDEFLENVDDFEQNYNFRFEQEGGTQIVGHSRNVIGSVRQKDDKRKKKREEKKARKDEERKIKAEEIKRLKNLKKQEIQNRLNTIAEITGNTGEHAADYLEADWNPDQHDQQMEKVLGVDGDYYEQEEELTADDLLKRPGNKEFEGVVPQEVEEAYAPDGGKAAEEWNEDENWEENAADVAETGDNADDTAAADVPQNDRDDGHPDWYLCDTCNIPIPGGKKYFECRTCEDFVQCQKCFRTHKHQHRMQKKTIPSYCMPPEDYKGKVFVKDEDEKEQESESTAASSGKKKNMMNELHELDYEDIIGGDIACRFKYSSTRANDFGMSTDFILETDESKLNSLVGLKKLAPYREREAEKINVKRKMRELQYTKAGSGKKAKTDNEWGGNWSRGEKNTGYDAEDDQSGHAKNQTHVHQVVKKMKGGKTAVSTDRAAAYGAEMPRSQPIHKKKKDKSGAEDGEGKKSKKSKKKGKRERQAEAEAAAAA